MIIGITGKAGAGKDTVADYLQEKLGFEEDAFAAPIKRLVADIFGLTLESMYDPKLKEEPLENWPGWTRRSLMQFIGTELFRDQLDKDIWVKSLQLRNDLDQIDLIITDARFPNEREKLKSIYGDAFNIIRVNRPGYDGETAGGIKGHASEAHEVEAEYVIDNDGALDDLYVKVEGVIRDIRIKTGEGIKKTVSFTVGSDDIIKSG